MPRTIFVNLPRRLAGFYDPDGHHWDVVWMDPPRDRAIGEGQAALGARDGDRG